MARVAVPEMAPARGVTTAWGLAWSAGCARTQEEEGASENKSNGSGALDLPWEGAERDDDDDMGQDQAHVAVKSRTENKFAVPMRSDMDFADAERYLQRAFVVRARTFGINDEATAAARTNLLKCYIAQNKMDDIRVRSVAVAVAVPVWLWLWL